MNNGVLPRRWAGGGELQRQPDPGGGRVRGSSAVQGRRPGAPRHDGERDPEPPPQLDEHQHPGGGHPTLLRVPRETAVIKSI